jgi:outer membrane protein TolC/ABC-type uncharacterized transport system substrate-binding protein
MQRPEMKIQLVIPAMALVGLSLCASANAGDPVEIGIVADGPWRLNQQIIGRFQDEILGLTEGEFVVRFPEDKTIIADWTREGVNDALDRLLADRHVDMLLALGFLSSGELAKRTRVVKPSIAPFVVDPEVQGITVGENGTSGVTNLQYLTFTSKVNRDIKAFQEIFLFKTLHIVTDMALAEAIPPVTAENSQIVRDVGIAVHVVAAGFEASKTLEALGDNVEAVYLGMLGSLSEEQSTALIQALNDRKLPTFSFLGESEVRRGVLAGLGVEPLFVRRARRVALNVQRILLGDKPEDLPVAFSQDERLTINMATARSIGVYPSWAILTEAQLINQLRTDVGRHLTLSQAVEEAVDVNLDLLASSHAVAAGAEEVNQARSALFPQLGVGGRGVVIDDDRAEASFGTQPERSITGSATVTQLLYSEEAWANLRIQGHLQISREAEYEAARLDVALDAATAYLNVLRAKTMERIRKANLQLSRRNLELARVRQSIGFSGPSDVYRWESEIALNRKSVIEANANRNLAEIALNRLLHQPSETPFTTEEVDIYDPWLACSDPRVLASLENPWIFRVFRAFGVSRALSNSPELRELDALIQAQRRALSSARNAFWIPTVALQAELSEIIAKGGAGTEPQSGVSVMDDTNWSVGISASLPLFAGGSRFSAYGQAHEEIWRLELTRDAVADRIEQRVASAMHVAGASYAGIKQAREAAEAAQRNLNLVVEAYSRGLVSIIELLDAQNAALVADEIAADATYDFIIDHLEVQRAMGGYYFELSPEKLEAFFRSWEQFYQEARDEPLP